MARDFGGPTPEEMGIKEGGEKNEQLAILEHRCAALISGVEELRAIIDVVQKQGGDLGGIEEETQLATIRNELGKWSYNLLKKNEITLTHEELADKLANRKGVVSIDGLNQEALLSAIAKNKIIIGPKGIVGEAYAKRGIVFNEGIRGTESDPGKGEKLDAWVFYVPGDYTNVRTQEFTPGDSKRVKGSTSQMRVLFIDGKDNLAITDIYSKEGNRHSAQHELYKALQRAGFTNLPDYDPRIELPQYANLHNRGGNLLREVEQVHHKLNTEI